MQMKITRFILYLFAMPLSYTSATIWHVGPTQTYTLPSQVKNLVQDGDTIYIDGGVYLNDATKWMKNNLTFIGLGTGNNRTILQHTLDIPNRKGIFLFENPGLSDNIYIENIVFDGARIADSDGANGAGIRFQSVNLTVNNCKFMNCQNGILEGNASVNSSNVIIKNSEFENNGYQLPNDPTYSGYEHHIYISASADTLLVENCYFHDPRGQANSLKTRAQRSFILYNLIDEASGYGSWEINIAQGGLNVIMGNIIIQGTSGANHGIVGYDAAINQLEDFYFINNTVINKFTGNINYLNVVPSSGINTFKVYNNIFASTPGANNSMFLGNISSILDSSNNFIATDYLSLGFMNPAQNDFSLTSSSVSLIDAGTNAGNTNTGFTLLPMYMYHSYDTSLITRTTGGTSIDIGAYEFYSTTGIFKNEIPSLMTFSPNPSGGVVKLIISDARLIGKSKLEIYGITGVKVYSDLLTNSSVELNFTGLGKGFYLARLFDEEKCFWGKFEIR